MTCGNKIVQVRFEAFSGNCMEEKAVTLPVLVAVHKHRGVHLPEPETLLSSVNSLYKNTGERRREKGNCTHDIP